MRATLYEANEHFRPFPAPEEVFAERMAKTASYYCRSPQLICR